MGESGPLEASGRSGGRVPRAWVFCSCREQETFTDRADTRHVSRTFSTSLLQYSGLPVFEGQRISQKGGSVFPKAPKGITRSNRSNLELGRNSLITGNPPEVVGAPSPEVLQEEIRVSCSSRGLD